MNEREWAAWGRPTGPEARSFGPIVDYGYDVVPCPWCGNRECLKPSEKGPLPDGRTLFFCTVNEGPAFRAYVKDEERVGE